MGGVTEVIPSTLLGMHVWGAVMVKGLRQTNAAPRPATGSKRALGKAEALFGKRGKLVAPLVASSVESMGDTFVACGASV